MAHPNKKNSPKKTKTMVLAAHRFIGIITKKQPAVKGGHMLNIRQAAIFLPLAFLGSLKPTKKYCHKF